MNSDLSIYLNKFVLTMQYDNICEELAGNTKSVLFLLKQCSKNLSSFEQMDKNDVDDNIFNITSVIDYAHEDLHIGHWSEVQSCKRKLYSYSCCIKMFYLLLAYKFNKCPKNLQAAILLGDLALMLGEPLTNCPNVVNDIISLIIQLTNKTASESSCQLKNINEDMEQNIPRKTVGIESINCPSIECFKTLFYDSQIPLVLKECISHWPALKKWRSLDYILRIAGNRTVPVELGLKYTDESWSQKLMTIEEFINEHILKTDSAGSHKAYLAQHRLLDQIPELAKDIYVPDYCYISEVETAPEINVWFGPQGTISPLHTDPKHNFLAQVFGVKQVILFSPQDSKFLYPHDEEMLNNTSKVDLDNPDLERYPLFTKASPISCTLHPGDMLYIPPKWWHHVTSKTVSFSVSFWWE